MFNNSMLGEILKLLPRREIQKITKAHKGDHYRKSFRTWDHLVAMLTGQLTRVASLRDLEVALNSHPTLHHHLAIKGVKRSTLADANSNRDFHLFRDIAVNLMERLNQHSKELKGLITVLDASLIRLSGRGHEWAKETTTRAHNMGLKIHVQYNCCEDQVEYVEVDNANCNDITIAQKIALEENRIYVFDKGYCDYNWWKSIADNGSIFVTRLKKNASYKVLKNYEILDEDKGFILKDQLITLSNRCYRAKRTNKLAGVNLRLVEIRHPGGKEKPFMIVTNATQETAQSIAGWYKKRWSIELLFKWLKQNLQIKRFMGESRNAIMIQIFVAMIVYVLLKSYKDKFHKAHMRLKDLSTLVKTSLFMRPKLQQRIEKRRRSLLESSQQLSFGFDNG
jgi:putative transposase